MIQSARPRLLALAVLAALPSCGDSGSPSTPPADEGPGTEEPAFDEEGTWSGAAPLPEPLAFAGVAVHRDRIYVAGGSDASDEPTAAVRRYDPDADAWSRLSDLPEPVTQAVLLVHADTLLLVGGHEGSPARPRTDVLAYDPDADAWSEHSLIPDPRDEHGAVSVAGKVVLFGGGSGLRPANGDSTALLEADGWRRAEPMPGAPRFQTAFGALADTVFTLNATASSSRLDVFDPATDAWLSGRTSPLPPGTIAGGVWRGRLHVVSHRGADSGHRAYDPATATWLRLPPPPLPVRHTHPVGLDGRLYLIGGDDREQTRVADVQVFSQP